jgi:ribosomal protein S6
MSKETNLNTNEGVKLYELAFNFVPNVGEEGSVKEAENLKKIIESKGGKIISESAPALISLAYTMIRKRESKREKYENAYFGWVKFEAEAESVEEIKSELDSVEDLLRYMIIMTVKETDIPAVALSDKKEVEESDEDNAEEKEEVEVEADASDEAEEEADEEANEEEIDKAVDDIVEEEK